MSPTTALADEVSIHAPLRREERPPLGFLVPLGLDVSIHAPLRREERLRRWLTCFWSTRFQSTPPSGERSDPSRQGKGAGSVVSIHAPLRREERLKCCP